MKYKNLTSRFISFLLAAVMVCSMLPVTARAAYTFSGGSGTAADPYLVSTPLDLQNLSSYSNKHFRQTGDISMEGYSMTTVYSFSGIYDGGGYAITNLTFSGVSDGSLKGIFNKNTGTIKNLSFRDCNLTFAFQYKSIWAGGIVGENTGTVTDCSFSGTLTVKTDNAYYDLYGGGIVGKNTGTVENCVNTGTILVAVSKMGCAAPAGIVGYNTGAVKNCLNEGTVLTENAGNTKAGGIVGYNTGTVRSVKNTGSISGTTCWHDDKKPSTSAYVGGIVGQNKGTVSYAQNYGQIEAIGTADGDHTYAGGIVGFNGGAYNDPGPYVVEYSKNYATILAHSTGGEARTGGIAGTVYKNSYARYCCNQGNMNASDSAKYSSALAGGITAAVMYGTLTQCCNHGEVRVNTHGYDSVQGCGVAPASTAVITDCYNDGDVYSDYAGSSRYARVAGLFIDTDTTCQNSYNLGALSTVSSGNRKYGLYSHDGAWDENILIGCYTTRLYSNTQTEWLITEEQAKQKDTFVGYDFDRIWDIDPDINGGHPYLRNVPEDDDPNWYIDPALIVPVTGISLDKTSVSLELGDTAIIKAMISPENALNKNVCWYSGNVSVAEVSQAGVVTANGGGTAYIYAETEDGGFTASCRITVNTRNPYFSGGSGTEADPYLIATAEDLQNITYKRTAHYRQVADISLAGQQWRPIGSMNNPFSGSFDGGGFAIWDMTVDATDLSWVGLFGYSTGTVKNVRLDGCTITAVSDVDALYCGAVVGYNAGSLSGCIVGAELSATTLFENQNTCAGGICGYSSRIVSSCAFAGSVAATVSQLDSIAYAGGIMGYGRGADNCRNSGTISTTGAIDCDCYSGGIVGCATGGVTGCWNGGSITAERSRYSFAGGITGLNAEQISRCANSGEIYASTAYKGSSDADPTPPDGALAVLIGDPQALAGGITGSNYGTATFCENEGYVRTYSEASSAYSGGVVGYNNGGATIVNCKNSGEVTAHSTAGESRAGGIASSSHYDSWVRLCCNTGKVSITENGVYNSGIAGGIVAALQYGHMEQCCNHADIYATSTLYYLEVGGILGSMSSEEDYGMPATLTDCYNVGNVHVDFTGKGVVSTSTISGLTALSGYGNTVENCYNTGKLTQTGGRTEIFGLFRTWALTSYTATGCYVTAMHLSTDANVLITDDQSRQQDTFVEYDFGGVWGIDPNINDGRPYLINLPAPGGYRWYYGVRGVLFPSSAELNVTAAELHVGETQNLRVTYLPENATDVSWSWTSSNPSVAQVSASGEITALSPGTAVITVRARNGGCSAACMVTVTGHDCVAGLCTVCGRDCVEVTVDNGTLTVTCEDMEPDTLIWLVSYDVNGKFVAMKRVTLGEALILPTGERYMLLFVNENWIPLRKQLEL